MTLDPFRWAKFYAGVQHAGQTYSGELPYTHHLAVDGVLVQFEEDILRGLEKKMPAGVASEFFFDLRTAAWLHDIIEDTRKAAQPVKAKDIAEMFGDDVAGLVDAMTKGAEGNRAVKAASNYLRLCAVPGAVTLKLADRISNVEQGGSLVQMYRKEHEDFRRALCTSGENEALWAHLDALLV